MTEQKNLGQLETELFNSRTKELDVLPTEKLVKVLHQENFTIAKDVEEALPAVVDLVDRLVEKIKDGGKLYYVGAGTSGRLGVLDASECPPTFGVEPDLVQGVIAGGTIALTTSQEGVEDKEEIGRDDLKARGVNEKDTVVGIASSGRTPYVVGALKYAGEIGALTGCVINVSNSTLENHADIVIRAITGAEPISGSTRLKAGTAQKMILNLITNSTMVRLGKVYGNLMVDLKATNSKLKDRAVRIVMKACDTDRDTAAEILNRAGGNSKTAIVMQLLNVSQKEAFDLLDESKGFVRGALESYKR